jgi:diguanylate cyclase (GGDEF)-like protein/PAS domain S-box-containing protein
MIVKAPIKLVRPVLAMLPPLVALAIQWALWDFIQPFVWFLFYPAVFISSWIGGRTAGLWASAISATLVWWFFIPPEHSFVKENPGYLFPAAVFIGMGVLFSLFHGRLRKANQQAEVSLAAVRSAHEEINRLYEQTKKLDALKTQFFATVSHELRTPLALILGPTERMLASAQTTEAARRDLDVIARNARTLLRHVNDLLDVSKLEAARMEAEYVDIDLVRLVRFVAGHFEVLAQEQGITYSIKTPEQLRAQVDPEKLRRVLLNLLSNAFKFTPAGGRVRLTLRAEDGRAILEVGDSGPGIPPDKREAVFEHFRQLEGGTTRRFGGTGLGLASAQDFVTLHGGTLSVTDAPEGGALFVVDLPQLAAPGTAVRGAATEAAAAEEAEEARQAVEELRGRPDNVPVTAGVSGALILVVEDNREMNRFICENLATGHRVAAAFDGKEGFQKALELRPDLIVSDVMMPEMSGEELVHAIRAHAELDRMPIVLLTAKADDELRVRLLREGAQDYLTKPFSVEELRARVGSLVARKSADEALQRSEERFRSLFESVAEGVFGVDLNGGCTFINPAGLRLLGYRDPAQLIGKPMHRLIHHTRPDGSPCLTEECRVYRAFREDHDFHVDNELFWRSDGSSFDVEYRSHPVRRDGRVEGAVVAFADISERKRAEQQLRQAAIVFDSTNEGIMITDVAARIVAVNRAFEAISGYSAHEVLGENPRFQKSGHQDEAFYRQMWATLETSGQWQGEIWNRRKNGEVYPVWENISAVKDAEGRVMHYVSVLSDISPIKRAEEKLRHLAHHDALTGLPNRLLFAANLDQALERARRHRQPLALMFLDLDRFKLVNDTLGHAVGDRLLQVVAQRLKACVRAEDTVARLGGDEFTVILGELGDPEDAALLAEKLIGAVREPLIIDEHELAVSASIGISLFPENATDSADLTKAADAALYRAKERGRNAYEFYTPELTARALAHFALEQALSAALVREEFVLYYQPQVELATGRVVGVEALIRWQHPHQGLLDPDRFIGVAEDSGLIEPLGEWVLRTACRQAVGWRTAGLAPTCVAVNLSGRHLLRPGFAEKLETILHETGLQRSGMDLELEITESVLHHVNESRGVLERLKALGVRLAVDDFGAGHSSLAHLRYLPIDTLKIDRSFVADLPHNTQSGAIVEAIVALGRGLKLKVVGEGVETAAQRDFLRALGCDYVQGHLYGRAVPAEVIVDILAAGVSSREVNQATR